MAHEQALGQKGHPLAGRLDRADRDEPLAGELGELVAGDPDPQRLLFALQLDQKLRRLQRRIQMELQRVTLVEAIEAVSDFLSAHPGESRDPDR